jgi:hypothetical protein
LHCPGRISRWRELGAMLGPMDGSRLHVGRMIVAYRTTKDRTVLERHRSTFAATLPPRAGLIRTWLRDPDGPIAGMWLVSGAVMRPSAARRQTVRP